MTIAQQHFEGIHLMKKGEINLSVSYGRLSRLQKKLKERELKREFEMKFSPIRIEKIKRLNRLNNINE